MAQINPSVKQKQTQGHREQACDWGRRVGMEGLELGISRCKLLYIEWIGKKVLLYSTGSYSIFNILLYTSP